MIVVDIWCKKKGMFKWGADLSMWSNCHLSHSYVICVHKNKKEFIWLYFFHHRLEKILILWTCYNRTHLWSLYSDWAQYDLVLGVGRVGWKIFWLSRSSPIWSDLLTMPDVLLISCQQCQLKHSPCVIVLKEIRKYVNITQFYWKKSISIPRYIWLLDNFIFIRQNQTSRQKECGGATNPCREKLRVWLY